MQSNKSMFKWDVAIWPQRCEFSSVFRFRMLHSSFFNVFNVFKFELHEQPILKKADIMFSSYFTEEKGKKPLMTRNKRAVKFKGASATAVVRCGLKSF